MDQTTSKQVSSMTNSMTSPSLSYRDLVVHIQTTQNQMNERIRNLDDWLNKENNIKNQLNSHSLTIVDPYGNSITEQYMDHESISVVLKTFEKKYIPKCLHQRIRFGHMIENVIVPMDESQLKLTVAHYENKYPIITYSQVTVWIGDGENIHNDELMLKTLLTDDKKDIQMRLKTQMKTIPVELKTSIFTEKKEPNRKDWNEGIILHPQDTIMSKSLYEDHSILMVKGDMKQVNRRVIHSRLYHYSLFTD